MRRGPKLPAQGPLPAPCPLVFLGSPGGFPCSARKSHVLFLESLHVPFSASLYSQCPVPLSPVSHILCIPDPTSPVSPYPVALRWHNSPFPVSSKSCAPHVTILGLMFSCPVPCAPAFVLCIVIICSLSSGCLRPCPHFHVCVLSILWCIP